MFEPLPALALLSLVTSFAPTTPQSTLEQKFVDPPAQNRILKLVHQLPAALEAQDALLEKLRTQGFGGMATNVPFRDGYVENGENWSACERTVRRAKELGMALWLYDELGYPSGNAGGITLRDHPEWEARGLLCMMADAQNGAIEVALPPGTLVSAAAYPLQDKQPDLEHPVDLAQQVVGGKLTWQAPEGAWRVMVITEDRLYEGTHATKNYHAKMPYINLLMSQPTDRFIEVTHQAYANRFGDNLGEFFISTFTDEPSLMSLFMDKQPWSCLPWSAEFAHEFETRRGYAIAPMIPALFAGSSAVASRARYDFWQTVGELVSGNYFGRIQEWCGKHGVLSGGHLLSEENIVTHVPLYGDFFQCARRLDAPSIDCLTSIPDQVPWYIARLIGSVAELEGRSATMSETSDHVQRWRMPGDTRPIQIVTEDEIRGTINRQVVNGITTFTSYYSFKDLTDEQLQRINLWTGRCASAMEGGRQVTDVAVLYPVQSIWRQFIPSREGCGDVTQSTWQVDKTYRQVSEALYTGGRDFTYIDAQTLIDGEVDKGTLKYRGLAWRAIVLPCVDTLPQKAWDKLAAFWNSGGKIIAVAALPLNNEREFPSPDAQKIAQAIFSVAKPGEVNTNDAGGASVFVSTAEKGMSDAMSLLPAPDLRIDPQPSPVRYTHRKIGGKDRYFIINDSDKPWEGKVSFSMSAAGKRFDPAIGKIDADINPSELPVSLGAYGALIFEF